MKREICSACEDDFLDLVVDLGESPIADAYTDEPAADLPTYPLQLLRCSNCGLIQLGEVLSTDELFGRGYSFYSSSSQPLSAYHRRYAETVIAGQPDLYRGFVVEIGCNDGDMLRHFAPLAALHLGVDPAAGPVAAARDRGLHVLDEPFGFNVAERIRSDYRQADLIIANHVLAHVGDVNDMLAGIRHLLAPNGVAWIEVQYLPDLIVNNAFDLIYHEHANHFSLLSLQRALRRHDLRIRSAAHTDRQGGSIRVAVTAGVGDEHADLAPTLEAEMWANEYDALATLQPRAEWISERLFDLIDAQTGPVIGYAAPAKATTLIHYCGLDAHLVRHIIDSTPAKQGRYVPGTSIQIVPEEDAALFDAAAVIIFGWNYAGAIMRKHTHYTRQGRWIVPIPAPMLL